MSLTSVNEPVVLRYWQTPVYECDLEARYGVEEIEKINDGLRRLVLEPDHSPSAGQRNTSGVIAAEKSHMDLLRSSDPHVKWLRGRIAEAVDALSGDAGVDPDMGSKLSTVAEAWAIVYRQGGSHRLHTHHDSAWSGVYYVDTGGVDEDAGNLQLLDPRPAAIARQVTDPIESIRPKPGLIVAFPGWLPHSVRATLYEGRTRICIAFNVGYMEREDS